MTDAARIAAARPYADEIWQRVLDLTARGITSPSGKQVFPGEHEFLDAGTWDRTDEWTNSDRVWLIAELRRREDEQRRSSGTELTA